MSYREAMEAAGAVVHQFEQFGDYQGSWYALITVDGETGWTSGSYGSCSGCDAFEAEFCGWPSVDDYCDAHPYDHNPECRECVEAKRAKQEKLADFGRGYTTTRDLPSMLAELDEQAEWSSEAEAAAKWIRSFDNRDLA